MTVHPWLELPSLLESLDRCLAAALPLARARYGTDPGADPFRGLYVGDDEVARLVAVPLDRGPLGDPGRNPWPRLAQSGMELDPFETAVVVLALGPEVDLKYERIYAYLQDDVSARTPRVALALDLFCPDLQGRITARDRFGPDATLRREGILQLVGTEDQPLLARRLLLDPQFVRHVLGGCGMDERVATIGTILEPVVLNPVVVGDSDRRRVVEFGERARRGEPLHLVLTGPDQVMLERLAHTLAADAELQLLRVDAGAAPLPAALLAREGACGIALHIVGAPKYDDITLLARAPVVFITTDQPDLDVGESWTTLHLAAPDAAVRRQLWARQGSALSDGELDRLAARYRLTTTQIEAAARTARATSAGTVRFAELAAAARNQSRGKLDTLARLVPVSVDWNDLILPPGATASLRELCERVVHRSTVMGSWGMSRRTNGRTGVNALFAGATGTGKTTAAQVVAGELGLDLYAIDLSGVVSKYIGETEKNLDAIFEASADTDVVLLFDEADALFGKRSTVHDSHDRYANLEISYLLQRMEAHDGVAILATNLQQNLDEAFLRRLDFTVRFPFPEEPERRRIWSRIWPLQTPVGDLDLDELARGYKLSGGNIRNVAIGAAFRAAGRGSAVEMDDVRAALSRELDKLGGGSGLVRTAAVTP